jgi:hypothetical protein
MKARFLRLWLSAFAILLFRCAQAQEPADGVSVSYQLPQTGSLPQTYRVTLAIVDPKNPEWILSQFARGVVRTVTTGYNSCGDAGGKVVATDGLTV